jgi:hypothetical protein
MSLMLSYALVFPRISYKLKSKRELVSLLLVYVMFGVFITCIFYLRWLRQGFVLDVPELYKHWKNIILQIRPEDMIILILLFLFFLIFWLLLVRSFYRKLNVLAQKLFLYYYQYDVVREYHGFFTKMRVNYTFFLIRRVLLFTKKPKYLGLAPNIWPRGITILERLVFFGLIPSLLLYDLLLNAGLVEKIFIVFPWFFLYSLLRSLYFLLISLYNDANVNRTYRLYGFQ